MEDKNNHCPQSSLLTDNGDIIKEHLSKAEQLVFGKISFTDQYGFIKDEIM